MQNVPEKHAPNEPIDVVICIATFQRPQLLQTLFEALAQLSFRKVCEPSLQILVVDNDAAQSARPVCQIARFPWPIHYVCEPLRGIARARNRAIVCAAQANFLAFIDDDEVPVTHWLDELLWAQFQFQADVVSGPVIPAFTDEVPKWIRNGRFFHRPVFETGHAVNLFSTNNAFMRTKILRTVPCFDEQFNFSGGEDTHFFLRVREAGFRMIYSREGVVYEPVATQRANFLWLLRRGFQVGNSWAHCEGTLHSKSSVKALRVLKEFVHIGRGFVDFLASPFGGKAQLVRSLQTISAGVGTLAGVAGYRFLPYGGVQETRLRSAGRSQRTPPRYGL